MKHAIDTTASNKKLNGAYLILDRVSLSKRDGRREIHSGPLWLRKLPIKAIPHSRWDDVLPK